MIKVAIADDHTLFRHGLKQILSDRPAEVSVSGEAGTRDELMVLLKKNQFDVLILDISMPGSTGLETLATIKSEYPNLNILVLSMYPSEQYAVRALKAGAQGYMTKECVAPDLIDAVTKISRGGRFITDEVVNLLASEVISPNNGPLHKMLSDRELEVFLLLGSGSSVKEISERLSLSIKTVSTYRSRILEKLRIETTADIIRYVIDHDLLQRVS